MVTWQEALNALAPIGVFIGGMFLYGWYRDRHHTPRPTW